MTERKLRCPVCNDITAHRIVDEKGFKLMYEALTQGPWVVRECEECEMQTVVVYGGLDYIELGHKDTASDVRRPENQTLSFWWAEPPGYEEPQKTGIDAPSSVSTEGESRATDLGLSAWKNLFEREGRL